MSFGRTLAALCAPLLLALGMPVVAQAAATPLGISSDRLDVAMSPDGSASVAYFTYATSPGGDATLHVCRIPAGGSTCTETAARVLPLDAVTGPWIVAAGNRLTAVAGSHDGATEGTYAFTSANGQTSWSAATKVAPVTATDVEASPAGNRLYIASRYSPSADATDDASFSSAPIPGLGGPGDGNASALLESSSDFSGDSQQVGVRPDGRPLVFVSGSGNQVYSYAFGGTAGNDTQLNDKTQWGARTDFSLGDPFTRNGGYEAATGAGRLWFGYEALSTELLVRQYSGTGFGPAINPDCTTRRFSSGSQDPPALAIGRTGLLNIAYTGSNGDNLHLGYFVGTADGSAFSPYQEIYSGPDEQRDVEIATDPTSDTGGIIVWTANAITGGPLKFARFPAATPAACPVATPSGGSGGSATPAPGAGTATPKPPVVVPPVVPAKPKVKTTDATVASGGAKVSFETPNTCVPSGGTFTVTLKFAAVKKKNNVFVKIFRVDFSGTGLKTKKDTKAPFKQALKVKVGTKKGSTVSVNARAYIKVKKGKSPTKSIGAKVTVCS